MRRCKLVMVAIVATVGSIIFFLYGTMYCRHIAVPMEWNHDLEHAFRAPISLPPLCDFDGGNATPVNKTSPTWQQLYEQFPMLEAGGHYKPPNCRTKHNIAVIIPFRNREEHLKLFLQHMHPFLQAQRLEYTIYVVEQDEGVMFNRALLMNIGYLESSKQIGTNCFVFHDIDLLPMNASINYSCKPNVVKHPARYVRQNKFKILYKSNVGGVLIFQEDEFRKVNGFSNVYFGWGGEDDDMHQRLVEMRLPIERPASDLFRYESWSHKRELELVNRREFINTAVQRMHKDGLNSAKYTVIHAEKRHLYTWIYVSISQTDAYYYNDIRPKYRPNRKDRVLNASI